MRGARTIWVKFSRVGFHRWPEAGLGREYLAERHRHRFEVEVAVEVGHGEREIEFHDLLDVAQEALGEEGGDLGALSCESLAESVLVCVDAQWPGRRRICSVSEDGECGATVEIVP